MKTSVIAAITLLALAMGGCSKPASQVNAQAQQATPEVPAGPARPAPKTLDEWAVTLKGMKPDNVIALLGRPDQADDTKIPGTDYIQWTIFKYYGLAGNKYTGKGETLSIAFLAGGQVRQLKQGDGIEITVPMNDQ